jgi:hypothetical protein
MPHEIWGHGLYDVPVAADLCHLSAKCSKEMIVTVLNSEGNMPSAL